MVFCKCDGACFARNFDLALLIMQRRLYSTVYRVSGPDVVVKDDCRLCFLFQIV